MQSQNKVEVDFHSDSSRANSDYQYALLMKYSAKIDKAPSSPKTKKALGSLYKTMLSNKSMNKPEHGITFGNSQGPKSCRSSDRDSFSPNKTTKLVSSNTKLIMTPKMESLSRKSRRPAQSLQPSIKSSNYSVSGEAKFVPVLLQRLELQPDFSNR